MSGEQLNHHDSPQNLIEWQYANQSLNMPPIPESCYNKPIPLAPMLDMRLFDRIPPSLPDFPTDSSFIERAAKFSSFSAMMNPLGVSMSIDHGSANLSGDSSSKKRIKTSEDMETEQGSQFSAEVVKENVECSSSTPKAGKISNGKNPKGSTDDDAKRDYIHVRARRGQATNSHSLAERVRRERISERMKYLQDLVPGCSKVTGKAVMLDEIINYVQSLQRQVEFLSMKLAAVNPSIDLNIEALLAKDPQPGLSAMGFPPGLVRNQLLQPQHGLIQTGMPGMANHADEFRRMMTSQFTTINGFKESIHQLPNQFETELQNMVQMNFGTNSPPSTTQGLNSKPRGGFPL